MIESIDWKKEEFHLTNRKIIKDFHENFIIVEWTTNISNSFTT